MFTIRAGALGIVNRRHFVRVEWLDSLQQHPGIPSLGTESLSTDFTAPRFALLVTSSRRPLKQFLLDQSRVAGLGNIYSSESLWSARLNPRRRAHRLTREGVLYLHHAVVKVLNRALECCTNPRRISKSGNSNFQILIASWACTGARESPARFAAWRCAGSSRAAAPLFLP